VALAERRAEIVWEGDLLQGGGKFTVGSGALGEMPITWAARTERSEGKTSPEELIAAHGVTDLLPAKEVRVCAFGTDGGALPPWRWLRPLWFVPNEELTGRCRTLLPSQRHAHAGFCADRPWLTAAGQKPIVVKVFRRFRRRYQAATRRRGSGGSRPS